MRALNHRVCLQMPTKLRRVNLSVDDELYAKLEELALSQRRSVSNMALILVENGLFPGGRSIAPKEEKRGGKRQGAGRPKKSPDTTDTGAQE